jgi:protein-tyrosine phosphatase
MVFSSVDPTDSVWIGSKMVLNDSSNLKKIGITHIVNVALELQKNDKLDKAFHVYHVPLEDLIDQPLDPYVIQAYNYIMNALNDGGKVFIHCNKGKSRSAAIVIYYLMTTYCMTFDCAYELLKKRYPIISLNQGFELKLKNLSNNAYEKCFT